MCKQRDSADPNGNFLTLRREIAELRLEIALANPPIEIRWRLAVLEARWRNIPRNIKDARKLRKKLIRESEHLPFPKEFRRH